MWVLRTPYWGLGWWNSCEWGWRECVKQNKWTAGVEHLPERKTPGKWTLYARATVGSFIYPCRYVFAEQNGTTDEHHFTCVDLCWRKKQVYDWMNWRATEMNERILLLCVAVSGWLQWGTNEKNLLEAKVLMNKPIKKGYFAYHFFSWPEKNIFP